MKSSADVRAEWLAHLHSTEPADRPRAEAGVRALYAAAGFREPEHLLWYPSPRAASWAVASLVPNEDRTTGALLDSRVLSAEARELLERARSDLFERLGLDRWDEVVQAIGESRVATLQRRMDPSRLFGSALLEARYAMVDDVASLFTVPDEDDALARAEAHFWGPHWGVLASAVHCPTTDFLLRQSFVHELTFSMLADDAYRIGDRPRPPVFDAAIDVARSAGMWWPYENAAILCDRPAEIHLDDQHRPHHENGPAVVFRDGWQVYAWHGKAVPERWIMQPERVPAGEYRGFDPTFVQWAKTRRAPTGGPRKRTKRSSILTAPLPADPGARMAALRAHAGGRLLYYDRYVSGAHRDVWSELIGLGAEVRTDPYAADALAVAYETMQRVEANVRTLVERLVEMRYVFTSEGAPSQRGGVVSQLSGLLASLLKGGSSDAARKPGAATSAQSRAESAHVPPGPTAAREVAQFEKQFGALPLSLRAFYEVVGEVNLMGRHPAIDPPNNPIAPDPLVVHGLDEGMVLDEDDSEDQDDEDTERSRSLVIAPDDLHKANVSGGDPYTMTIPDLRVDGELLDERHGLFFVDYLRLAFRFGGFPGYEGMSAPPAQVGTLADRLKEF